MMDAEHDRNRQQLREQQQWQDRVMAFQKLLLQVIQTSAGSQPDQVPSLVGQHMDLILSILQPHPSMHTNVERVLSEIIQNTTAHLLLQMDRTQNNNPTTTTTTATITAAIAGVTEDNDNIDVDDDETTEEEAIQQQVMDCMEFMFEFAESFVEEMKTMDDANKQLLGKLLKAATTTTTTTTAESAVSLTGSSLDDEPKQDDDNTISPPTTLLSREDEFDDLMEQCKGQLTPGFLRHLEGECERIANAPQTSPESLRLLQFLRTLQLRVVEELGMTFLGQEAIVLGQLLGYDDPQERMAVLQTGLSLRGVEFAQTMAGLTEQALADMTRIANARGGENSLDTDGMTDSTTLDPELVERVSGIHDAIQKFLQQQQQKQEEAVSK